MTIGLDVQDTTQYMVIFQHFAGGHGIQSNMKSALLHVHDACIFGIHLIARRVRNFVCTVQ